MLFRMATIIGLNEAENKIIIRDFYNGAVYDIGLDNHMHFQSMPLEGDIVLYYNLDDKIFKIVKIWQIADDQNKRQGEFLLKSGELQIQGLYGQYMYYDNNGSITFVDSTMLNEFQLTLDGFIAKLKKFQLDTYDGINFTIDKNISITRTLKKDETDFTATVTDNGVVIQNKKSKLTMTPTGDIIVDGANSVKIGSQLYNGIVTSGPAGTLPFCLISGVPIPCSKKCFAE